MYDLLQQSEYIDLIVPRGGHGLIQYVSENSRIPIVKHDAGICHCFVDASADQKMAETIVLNGKTQRPSVCNALETLLIDKQYPKTKELLLKLQNNNVQLRADSATIEHLASLSVEAMPLKETLYKTEYLDLELSVRIVDDLSMAIDHIQDNTSSHSEVIISNDAQNITQFEQALDSAAIFINCSSRFHDGGEFGLVPK